MGLLLALDLGAGSGPVSALTGDGTGFGSVRRPCATSFPHAGRVENDPPAARADRPPVISPVNAVCQDDDDGLRGAFAAGLSADLGVADLVERLQAPTPLMHAYPDRLAAR